MMWNFAVGWHYWKSAAYESKQKYLSQYLHVKHSPHSENYISENFHKIIKLKIP